MVMSKMSVLSVITCYGICDFTHKVAFISEMALITNTSALDHQCLHGSTHETVCNQ